MFPGDFDDFSSTSSAKIIKFYKNGDTSVSCDVQITSDLSAKDIISTIETKLKLRPVQKLRLFTSEGLEISPEELNYIKSGETIYASKGENFDRTSTLSEYDIVKQLGEGGFGQVFLATHKRTKEQFAIKFLKANSRGMANEIDRQFSEAETLKNLNHKNIVKVLNCFALSSMQVAFVMEYLDGGELLHYVQSKGKLSEEEARCFLKQIAEAIAYCHRCKIIHCDLKLENILFESKECKVIKVVDFGISGVSTNVTNESDGGSLDYMPPEFFNGSSKNVHPGVDVWALGCMLYAMVCGKLPFGESSESKIIERICSGKIEYDEAGKKLSKEVRNLLSKMLNVDPESRVNIYDVLDHPWTRDEKFSEESSIEEVKDAPEKEKEKDKKYSNGPASVGKKTTTTTTGSTLTKQTYSFKSATTTKGAAPTLEPGKRNSNLAAPDRSGKSTIPSPNANSTRKSMIDNNKISKK